MHAGKGLNGGNGAGVGKLPAAENFVAHLREGKAMAGFAELAVSARHGIDAETLDGPRKDPFGRFQIARAQLRGLTLLSNEKLLDGFGIARLWNGSLP